MPEGTFSHDRTVLGGHLHPSAATECATLLHFLEQYAAITEVKNKFIKHLISYTILPTGARANVADVNANVPALSQSQL